MKKFLLVVFIGVVLAIDLYGIVNDFITNYKENNIEVNKSYTVVYEE